MPSARPRALNWGRCPQTPTRGLHPWTRSPKSKSPRPGDQVGHTARDHRSPSNPKHRKERRARALVRGLVATGRASGRPRAAARTDAARARAEEQKRSAGKTGHAAMGQAAQEGRRSPQDALGATHMHRSQENAATAVLSGLAAMFGGSTDPRFRHRGREGDRGKTAANF